MNLRFSGFGGQGIVIAGVIYGQAAILDGKNVVQTQSYGSASRGGACKCDVIISDEEIHELEFPQPNILIAMSQQAYDKYVPQLKGNGILILEKDLVHTKRLDSGHHVYSISATDIAFKKFGRKIMANMVILGFMTAFIDLVSKEAVMQAIRENAPRGTEQINIEAYEEGHRLGTKHYKRQLFSFPSKKEKD